jgi:hypothetical protein
LMPSWRSMAPTPEAPERESLPAGRIVPQPGPAWVPLLRALALASAAFWLAAGALVFVGILGVGARETARLLGALMVGNGMAMAGAAAFMLRGHRLVDFTALALFLVNAALSIADQIGVLDVVSLAVSSVLAVGVVVVRYGRRNTG